jgi:uncharacterized delta-60 repeat protein
MRFGFQTVLLLLVFLLCVVPGVDADGMLDPSFGTGGIVITYFPGSSSAYSLVVLPDGRAVAAGTATLSLFGNAMAAARYLPSGVLDNSFGSNGEIIVQNPFFNSFAQAEAVLLQPDGRLVLVGGLDNFMAGKFFELARLNTDGSPDGSFGSGGLVLTPFPGGGLAVAGALQPDGRIVAVGIAGPAIAAARYNVDGSLDPTFGTGGQVTLPLAQPFAVRDVALQPDGKLVIAGTYEPPGNFDFGLVRLLPSGAADPSFDGDGLVTSDFGGTESGRSVVVLGDGRLVLGGDRSTTGTDFALVRYLADGSLDTTFGTGGLATADSGANEVADQLIQLPNGKLLVGGWTNNTNAQDFLLARFQPDGALDTSFGTGGFIRTDVGAPWNDQCLAVAMAGVDRVLTAGFIHPGTGFTFALARYIATTPVELLTFEVE